MDTGFIDDLSAKLPNVVVYVNDEYFVTNDTLICFISDFLLAKLKGTGTAMIQETKFINGVTLPVIRIDCREEGVKCECFVALMRIAWQKKATIKGENIYGSIHLANMIQFKFLAKVYEILDEVLVQSFITLKGTTHILESASIAYETHFNGLISIVKYPDIKNFDCTIWINRLLSAAKFNIEPLSLQHEYKQDGGEEKLVHITRALNMGPTLKNNERIHTLDISDLSIDYSPLVSAMKCLKYFMGGIETLVINLELRLASTPMLDLSEGLQYRFSVVKNDQELSLKLSLMVNKRIWGNRMIDEICIFPFSELQHFKTDKKSFCIINQKGLYSEGPTFLVSYGNGVFESFITHVIEMKFNTEENFLQHHTLKLFVVFTPENVTEDAKQSFCNNHPIYAFCKKKPNMLFDCHVEYNDWQQDSVQLKNTEENSKQPRSKKNCMSYEVEHSNAVNLKKTKRKSEESKYFQFNEPFSSAFKKRLKSANFTLFGNNEDDYQIESIYDEDDVESSE
jgi:hypothetical protein